MLQSVSQPDNFLDVPFLKDTFQKLPDENTYADL